MMHNERVLKVGIVGCGPSGLAAVKELKAAGFEPVAFDPQERLGGVFAWAWPGLHMTSSSAHTAFSDFPPEAGPAKIWSRDEYLAYLDTYADHFELRKHLRLRTRVTSATRIQDASRSRWKWVLGTQGPAAGDCEIWEVDALFIASGTNHTPKRPRLPGQESFTGRVLHSRDYSTAEEFAGKRVVLQGMGESGSDISYDVSKVAAEAHLSIRNTAGWVVPRQANGIPLDLFTNRVLWGLPRAAGGLLSWYMAMKDMLVVKDEVINAMGRYNHDNVLQRGSNSLGAYGTYGTKNHSFMNAVVEHGAVLRPGIARLGPGNKVTFTDGAEVEADALIQNTGFRFDWGVIKPGEHDAQLRGVMDDAQDSVRNLWKNCIHPEMGASLCFIGYARPAFGSQPPINEMQVRLCVAALKGTVDLSDKAALQLQVRADRSRWNEQYGSSQNVATLVDYVLYMNEMAAILGCHPGSLHSYVSTDPTLAWQLWAGPHISCQFRLKGPGAAPEVSRRNIRRFTLPLGVLFTSYTFVFSLMVQMLALPVSFLPLPGAQKLRPVGLWEPEVITGAVARKPEHRQRHSISSSKSDGWKDRLLSHLMW